MPSLSAQLFFNNSQSKVQNQLTIINYYKVLLRFNKYITEFLILGVLFQPEDMGIA